MRSWWVTLVVSTILMGLLPVACQQAPVDVTPIVSTTGMTPARTGEIFRLTPSSFPTTTPVPTQTPAFVLAPDVGKPVYPLSRLRILAPGEGSRLLAPIQLELSIIPGVNKTIEIELLDPGGQLLVKKIIAFSQAPSGQRILVRPLIDFEIPDVEMNGRLVVKTYDEYNRLVGLTSCELILLSQGDNEIKPAGVPYEAFLLTEPVDGQIVTGGVVAVSGYARPLSTSPVILSLVDENGVELSTRQLKIKADPAGSPVVFNTTLPYQVTKSTPVRLIIRQAKGSLPGPAVVFSLLFSIK